MCKDKTIELAHQSLAQLSSIFSNCSLKLAQLSSIFSCIEFNYFVESIYASTPVLVYEKNQSNLLDNYPRYLEATAADATWKLDSWVNGREGGRSHAAAGPQTLQLARPPLPGRCWGRRTAPQRHASQPLHCHRRGHVTRIWLRAGHIAAGGGFLLERRGERGSSANPSSIAWRAPTKKLHH